MESLKAGETVSAIKKKHGTCAETVRHVRRFMVAGGWTPLERIVTKAERPKPAPRPPRVGMTSEQRLQKHAGVVVWVRAGKNDQEVAELASVSVNTVRVVRRALAASVAPRESKGKAGLLAKADHFGALVSSLTEVPPPQWLS